MSPYIHPRRLCREGIFQGLYALEISSEKKEKILDDIFKRYSFNSLNQAFISDLFFKTIDNKEFLEKMIITHVENWEIQRIALLDKLILLMAICELYFMDDIPPKVTISGPDFMVDHSILRARWGGTLVVDVGRGGGGDSAVAVEANESPPPPR